MWPELLRAHETSGLSDGPKGKKTLRKVGKAEVKIIQHSCETMREADGGNEKSADMVFASNMTS